MTVPRSHSILPQHRRVWYNLRVIRLAPTALLALLLGPASASAAPIQLRMAAIAPDGTEWARELKAFSAAVQAATADRVRIKWYLGGIAGDENGSIDRIRR